MSRGRRRGNQPPQTSQGNDIVDPREEREVHVEMQSLTWNSPIPPPEILRGYNEILPDGAERLFRQFEIEANARREHMRRGQTHNLIVALSGRAAALIFALAALVCQLSPFIWGILGQLVSLAERPSPWSWLLSLEFQRLYDSACSRRTRTGRTAFFLQGIPISTSNWAFSAAQD